MTDQQPFPAWLAERRDAIDAGLAAVLDRHAPQEPGLAAAMEHALLQGGKRLRPALAWAASEALGGTRTASIAVGTAVELIHAYSLVHDDLPAMDDDALRRGHPTVHVAFDEATAILAGDALLTLAFEHLAASAELASLAPATRLDMVATLAGAAGAAGMVAGQALDIAATGQQLGEADLERVHRHKTGALIRCALSLGGRAASASAAELAALDAFGRELGLAFQIVDDVLDATADTATLGKPAGSDADGDKVTYVSLLGIEAASVRAETACARALAALEPLPDQGRLPDFVAWVRDRCH